MWIVSQDNVALGSRQVLLITSMWDYIIISTFTISLFIKSFLTLVGVLLCDLFFMNSKVAKCQLLLFLQKKMVRVVFPWRFNLFISTSSQSVKQRYRRLFNHICDMKSLFCRLKKYSYIEYSWFANIWNNLETIFYCSLQNKKCYAL